MKRKELEKRSSEISDEEIAEVLKSYGGHWVLLGEEGDEELLNVIDNDIFKKFQAMDYIEDDEVWSYTKRKYLLKTKLKRFSSEQELAEYIEQLTKEKYG